MAQRHVVLQLGLQCREQSGQDLIEFLRRAKPFYESLPGVKVTLLRSLDRPGHFIEVVEYTTQEAFQADLGRLSADERMKGFLAEWRELLTDPPEVEHFAEVDF
jgi:hypothetical protein